MIVQSSSGNSQLWSSGISAGWARPTFMVKETSFTQSGLVTNLNHIYKGRSRLVFEGWLGASARSLHGNETATGCRHSHPSFGYCLGVVLLDKIDNLMSLSIVWSSVRALHAFTSHRNITTFFPMIKQGCRVASVWNDAEEAGTL